MSAYTLRAHKRYHGEFYMQETLPGTLQYNVSPDRLKQTNLFEIGNNIIVSNNCFSKIQNTQGIIEQVLPNTKKGKSFREYGEILVLLKKTTSDGGECLKAAIYNRNEHKIALMTALRNVNNYNDSRTIESQHEEYRICQCRMTAPLIFWQQLYLEIVNY